MNMLKIITVAAMVIGLSACGLNLDSGCMLFCYTV